MTNKPAFERPDDIEQYCRRNSVRVYGLQETTSKNTTQVFLHLPITKLDLNMEDSAIDRCQYVGGVSTHNKPPVLVKHVIRA